MKSKAIIKVYNQQNKKGNKNIGKTEATKQKDMFKIYISKEIISYIYIKFAKILRKK